MFLTAYIFTADRHTNLKPQGTDDWQPTCMKVRLWLVAIRNTMIIAYFKNILSCVCIGLYFIGFAQQPDSSLKSFFCVSLFQFSQYFNGCKKLNCWLSFTSLCKFCYFMFCLSVLQVLMFLKGCWPLAPGIIWPLHPPCELTLCSSSPSSSSFHLLSSSIAISLFFVPFAALMSEFFDTDLTIQYELIIPNVSSVPTLLKCLLYHILFYYTLLFIILRYDLFKLDKF